LKQVIIDFKPSAFDGYSELLRDKRLVGLAERYYQQLFDFPPEEWGRLRREFGKGTFVSDHHTPFIIKVIVVEETKDFIKLYVVEFSRRA
jgi:hypothetical protein